MTHLRVTQYVESWDGMHVTSLYPGVFPYAFVMYMFGVTFVHDRIADGAFVPMRQEDTREA